MRARPGISVHSMENSPLREAVRKRNRRSAIGPQLQQPAQRGAA